MGNDQRYGGGSSSNNSSSSSSGGVGGGGGGGGKKGKNKSGGGGGSSNSSEKPKQPQRGLGVAQLEKIRLQSQMASCGFLPPHPHPHPHPHHHHHPLFPSFPTPVPPPPPPPPSLQHLQEDMRMQGGYNHQSALHSAASFGYSSPSIASSSSFGYPPNFMMGMGDHMERTGNIRYGESQPRWNPNNFSPMPDSQHYMQPPSMVTRHLLSHVEQNSKSRNGLFETTGGSNSQNSESSEEEDLDLELKL